LRGSPCCSTVQRDFIAQSGDPTDSGTGGSSIFPTANKLFTPEFKLPQLKHTAFGTLSMAVAGGSCGSQFFFTLGENIDYLDGKHVPFGRVIGEDGLQTLRKINEAMVDDKNRPLRDIRLRHVIVLGGLVIPCWTG
jgi:peptidyl-prolyl cis-trans isomerase-like 4